jgi:hypothetical protein
LYSVAGLYRASAPGDDVDVNVSVRFDSRADMLISGERGSMYSSSVWAQKLISRGGTDGFDRPLLTESRMQPKEVTHKDPEYVMRPMIPISRSWLNDTRQVLATSTPV